MQEMDISASDAPTSGVTSSPIRLWFTAPELGHPLINDIHYRPLHPRVGPFFREYLSRHEDMDDDDEEMGHLYTGLGECWPAPCWKIGKPNQLFMTTTRVKLPLIVIRDEIENVFRPRTQQEIPAKFKGLNSRARIYRA